MKQVYTLLLLLLGFCASAQTELEFSAEDIKAYEAVYQQNYVKHIRHIFNSWVNGFPEKSDYCQDFEQSILSPLKGKVQEKNPEEVGIQNMACYDTKYFKEPFIVWSVDMHIAGGYQLVIIPQLHPDHVFSIWIYDIDETCFEMRSFIEVPYSTTELQEIRALYKRFFEDTKHAG